MPPIVPSSDAAAPMNDLPRIIREAVEAVLVERGYLRPGGGGGTAEGAGESEVKGPGETLDKIPLGAFSPLSRARLVVLLTGGEGDWGALKLALRELAKSFLVDVVISAGFAERHATSANASGGLGLEEFAARVLDRPSGAEALALLPGARGLVVPLLTRTLSAKVSLGIGDSMAAALLLDALERGLRVVAVKSSADPDRLQAPPALLAGPNSLRHLMETYIQRLTAWGVRWVALDDLARGVADALAPPVESSGGFIGGGEGGGAARSDSAKRGAALDPAGGANRQGMAALVLSGARKANGGINNGGSTGGGSPSGGRRRFFTREDVWIALERGETELRAGPLDVVTPEAEEFAASHGVRIVRAE